MKTVALPAPLFSAALLCAPLLLLSACAPVYVPNSVNTPLLRERGEGQLGGRVNPGSGGELQAAAALTDHMALMANGSALWRSGERDKSFREHYFGEAGLGYFGQMKDWVGRDLHYEARGSALGEDGRPRAFFLEPAVGWQGGPPQVQVLTQVGISIAPLSQKVRFGRSAAFLSVGLRVRFDALRGEFFRE